ncbi:hypothetical protein GCM10022226_06380 [Sphaerisporangium flaviroseum]|uniref:Exonuclease SbcC n=1 Tax=Sphaerisporangium flaviroseum TaxID=509199 RepID=A0ABP7HEP0_9ACTN
MSLASRPILTGMTLLTGAAAVLALWLSGAIAAGEDAHSAEKRRYIAAAEAVCQEAGQAASTEGNPPDSPRAAVAELRRSAAAMTQAAARLGTLRPPRPDGDAIQRQFVLPANQLAARMRSLAGQAEEELAEGRGAEAVAVVERSLASDEAETALRSFAHAYGLSICAGE